MNPKLHFGMSIDPADCAWQLVKKIGFKEAPISEEAVVDHLNLRIKYFNGSQFFSDDCDDDTTQDYTDQYSLLDNEQYRQSSKLLKKRWRKPIDAALRGNTIWVDCEYHIKKQRAGICHEAGHKVIPWHNDLSYVKDGCIIDTTAAGFGRNHRQCEEDANCFSAHLLMPRPFFFEDMNGLSFSIETLEVLAGRYNTSIESTAIHYVSLATFPCALAMIESLQKDDVDTETGSWLRVRYSKGSPSFKHFIRPGTKILPNTAIAQASVMGFGTIYTDEVPGWVLGLRAKRSLILHCRSWGKEGDVLVLVEEPIGNQGRLF